MAINKVDLTVSQLLNDLSEGLTWLKKDDLGYGSIETKYGANEKQISAIRKHPKLKDADTSLTIFNIIDDTESSTKTIESTSSRSDIHSEQEPENDMVSKQTMLDRVESVSEAVDIFAQL
jgi:hypothetical protein